MPFMMHHDIRAVRTMEAANYLLKCSAMDYLDGEYWCDIHNKGGIHYTMQSERIISEYHTIPPQINYSEHEIDPRQISWPKRHNHYKLYPRRPLVRPGAALQSLK